MSRPRDGLTPDAIRQQIVARLCDALDTSPERIDVNEPFASYGLGSKDAVVLSGELAEWLGRRLSPAVFYDYPTVNALAEHLAQIDASPDTARSANDRVPIGYEPIAIVGLGCRFPGAKDLDEFRQLLREGRDAIVTLPSEREALVGRELLAGVPDHGRWGGFIDDVDAFDAPFFGISAAEAATMDPQQRVLLEVAWDALEHAGQSVPALAGSRTGVFVGISASDYAILRVRTAPDDVDAYFGTSNSPSVAAGRLAYQFGFHGPTLAIDTACSSSLVAVHLACQSLRSAECDLALAGGVNLMLAPDTMLWACRARILSKDGRCKTFDKAADGYVRAEGCGVVVLKRLADAMAANDSIVAVIRGSAVNHDGRSSGLTAPNGLAQQRVILQALANSGVAPEDVQYVEAHGTGTALGDPIEVRALGATMCIGRAQDNPLIVGSVKTNIGHLEAAAGIAGLIKTALTFEHDAIPRHLHLTEINPYIAQEHLPVVIADGSRSWRTSDHRVAAVSSFGLSGTNAHAVLESWPRAGGGAGELNADGRTAYLLPISARTETVLRARVRAFRDLVQRQPAALERICYTASVRRAHHGCRAAVRGTNAEEIARALTAWLDGVAQPSPSDPLAVLGAEYVRGGSISWEELFPSAMEPVALPAYAFERHRYWLPRPVERSLRERLRDAAPVDRGDLVRNFLAGEIARCLQIPAADLNPDQAMSGLGLDSLMAIDLVNRLEVELGVRMPPVDLLDRMTLTRLSSIVLECSRPPQDDPLPPAAPPQAPFALSPAQQRIWILDQFAGAQVAYVIPSAVHIRGPLDAAALREGLEKSVARHETLRTVFTLVDGQPMQVVLPHVDVSFPIVDLQHLPENSRRREAEQRSADEALGRFDLSRGPLFRTTLFRIAPEEHVWFVGIHHLVSDGSSLRILLREVLDSYDAGPNGRTPPAASATAPVVRYSQFVEWQRRRLASSQQQEYLDDWSRTLAGAAPLNLPTDRARPPDRTFQGSSEALHISQPLSARLRSLARDRGVTLYGVLLAAFQVLLARVSRQTDVSVGTPMANRTRPEFEPLVGCFANTAVIRSEIRSDLPFVEVLDGVQQAIRDAWTRQEVPFEKLVETLKQREAGRNPLFDVFFALNVPITATARGGTIFEPMFLTTRAAKFDLALFCEDKPEGIGGFLEYRDDLFDRATAARMLRRFVTLLEDIVDAPQTLVGRLALLEHEERALIERYNAPAHRPFSTDASIHALFMAQARRSPDATAVVDERESVSYAELNDRSDRVAEALRGRGCKPGVVVGLSVERSVDMVVALLAVLKTGSAYLPLDPGLPMERTRLLVEEAGAVLIDDLPQLVRPTERVERRVDRIESPVGSPDDLAYVIYTSGSTGTPKGVEVTHRNVVNLLESMAREPGLTSSDTLLAVTALSFDIAALELFLPLIVGARLVVASRDVVSDGAKLARAIEESRATVMQATPATWRILDAAGYRPDHRLKVLCGGEALSRELAATLTSAGADVWNMYGPTETTIWSATERVAAGHAPSLGRPIANTEIHLFDDGLQPVPIGVPGEIYIGGAGVARGYRNKPELTSERFIERSVSDAPGRASRLYRTGDLGYLRADGTLQFLGRSDHQVKIRGFRVEPGEIETALARHPDVQQVTVIARQVREDDVRLTAFVEAEASAFSPDAFRRHLAAQLPAYMIPSEYVRVGDMPLTPNGKVDRKALAAMHVELSRRPVPIAPRTPTEADLAAVWADVLAVEHVEVQDSFFELGGHSLLAARAIARVEATFGVKLPLNLFYAQPTVGQHARYIDEWRAAASGRFERLVALVEGLSDQEAALYMAQLSTDGEPGGGS